jgi:HAMP domain-containing protein
MDTGQIKGSIRIKLLGGVLGVEVLLTLVFAAILLGSFRQRMSAESLKAVQKSQGVYDLILKGDTKMLSAALDGFLGQPAPKQIFAEHADREKLFVSVRDLFTANRARYGMTHFYFIDRDGHCYLRVHKPEQHGDLIERETFVRARATGATASGIELGKTAFALRVVTPYVQDRTLLGYVEFGEEIDHFDALVKKETGVDVAVLVDKRFLKEADYRGVRRGAGQPDDWDDIPGYALVSSTLPDRKVVAASLPPAEARLVDEPDYLGTMEYGQHVLAKGAFPLRDSAGTQVGAVLVLNDVTEQARSERLAVMTLVLVAVVTLLATFMGAAWFLRAQVIGPLVKLSEQAIELSMGNVEKKLETSRTDEIGLLIRSFERLRLSLKKALSLLPRRTATGASEPTGHTGI